MMPKATTFSRAVESARRKNQRWASPTNLIPLILTFSHPGEGTLIRYFAFPS